MSRMLPELCLPSPPTHRSCHHCWVKPCIPASVAASLNPGSTRTNSNRASVTQWACGFQVRGGCSKVGEVAILETHSCLSLGVWFAITPFTETLVPFSCWHQRREDVRLEPPGVPISLLPQKDSSETFLVPSLCPVICRKEVSAERS